MVIESAGVQTDLSKVVHTSSRPICHSSKPQGPTVHTFSSRPTYMRDKCSEHKLVGSCCLCLPSHGSPSQGDPESMAMQLPHHTNSPRLARGTPGFVTLHVSVSTTLLIQSHKKVFNSNPQNLNLYALCLGVD